MGKWYNVTVMLFSQPPAPLWRATCGWKPQPRKSRLHRRVTALACKGWVLGFVLYKLFRVYQAYMVPSIGIGIEKPGPLH